MSAAMTRLPVVWRRRNSALVAGLLLAVLAVAGLSDARVADAAAHAPRGVIHLGVVLSRIGLSGYMLIVSAAILMAMPLAYGGILTRVLDLPASTLGERAAYFFAVIAGSGLICQALKHMIGRARPRMLGEYGAYHFEGFSLRSGLESFPSGHTTTIFAAAFAFSLFLPRWRTGYYALAVVVGLARIAACNHFPSDVVGGAILGTVVAAWMTRVFAARTIAFSTIAGEIALKPAAAPASGAFP